MTDTAFPDLFWNPSTGEFGVAAFALAIRLGVPMAALFGAGAMAWQGYAPTPQPAAGLGQEAYEIAPAGGLQRWALRPSASPLAGLVADYCSAADAERDSRTAQPMPYDFGAIPTTDDLGAAGVAGVQQLQADANSIRNWAQVYMTAQTAVVLGQADAVVPLRTLANVWVQATAAAALTAVGTLFGRQQALVSCGAALKGTARAVTSVAGLSALPLPAAADWPTTGAATALATTPLLAAYTAELKP